MADEILSGASRTSLSRAVLCVRGLATRLSGWRMELKSERGPAAVVLVESPGGGAFYRGEGACLGWPQDQLERLYRSLLPDEPPEAEPLQLG